jgi:hypothetical protein
MPTTFTPRGKVSDVLLRCAVSWQVRRVTGARGGRFEDVVWVDGPTESLRRGLGGPAHPAG